MNRRRTIPLTLATMMALLTILAACGGATADSDAAASEPDTTAQSTNPDAETSEVPAAGAGCAPIAPVPANYLFSVPGGLNYTGAEATWNPNTRVVRLGPEDRNEDLGSLTIVLDEPAEAGPGCLAYVTAATLSTSDVAVGTGPEINGKLYTLVPGNCGTGEGSVMDVTSLGDSQLISPQFCLRLQRSVSGGSGEVIQVTGQFVAWSD